MLARIQAARENESGFTLVELLIVIVILGILSGIVVFSVSGITSRGAQAACNADVASVTVASEAYYAQKNSWATAIPGAAGSTTLQGSGLLKTVPPAAEGIALSATGVVTANPLCSTLK
jgi:prepilin-type N-terminal cleavage/methylation domain-containing protein